MSKPLSLDEIASEMRKQQANPTSQSSSRTVWDSDKGVFVQLSDGEKPTASQNTLNTLAKEPYFLK